MTVFRFCTKCGEKYKPVSKYNRVCFKCNRNKSRFLDKMVILSKKLNK